MHMHDGLGFRPRPEDIHMHPPFSRGQIVPAIIALKVHFNDMSGLHLVINNSRSGNEKSFIATHADVAGGSLVDSVRIHFQAGLYDLAAQVEMLQLFHFISSCEGLTSRR